MVNAEAKVPLVSVVIPTNNRKHWVTEALESVFSQTFKDFEVIVVDDGSVDGTSEHLSEVFGSSIQLIRTEGTNCPTARNVGAQAAIGKYLAFLDDDERWYSNKLERQVSLLESSPLNVAMVGSACDYMDRDGQYIYKPSIPFDELTYENACVKPKLPGACSGCLIRKVVFDEMKGFDVSLTRNQDRDLWIKITRKYRVPMLKEILGTVRIHDSPRRNVTTDTIEQCRLEINGRIPEPSIRRKANAWTYFHLFELNWNTNRRKACKFLLLSFVTYPGPLPIDGNRLKMLKWRFFG